MSKVNEINKETCGFDLDPRVSVGVNYSVIFAWIGVIALWMFVLWGKKTPYDIWFLGVVIFITLLTAGLTGFHWYSLKHNYNLTKKIGESDFRKTLTKKGIWRD